MRNESETVANVGSALVAAIALPLAIWLRNPALALLTGGGIAIALGRRPFRSSDTMATYCLQAAIVFMGLKLDLRTIWALSVEYSGAVSVYVLATLLVGLGVGKRCRVEAATRRLISAGTAVCGGTAIATLSGLIRAQPQQTAVALAVVYLLNAIALVTFPSIGHALELSQLQFGLWCALAVHDTSSVIATASAYGVESAAVATTLKFFRTLFLIPLVMAASRFDPRPQSERAAEHARRDLKFPPFIVLFLGAAAVNSAVELPALVDSLAPIVSGGLLAAAMFLVGTDLTKESIRMIRGRVLLHASVLWLAAAPAALLLVLWLT